MVGKEIVLVRALMAGDARRTESTSRAEDLKYLELGGFGIKDLLNLRDLRIKDLLNHHLVG